MFLASFFLKNRDNVIDRDDAFDMLRGIYDRDGKKVVLSKELGNFFLIRVLRHGDEASPHDVFDTLRPFRNK